MKLIENRTWLALWLLLMLPVAAAQEILTIQKFSGMDNIPNFAKEGDELTIQALAQMLGSPTPDVAVQRVRIYNADTYEFMDSCTAQANNMQQCTSKTTDLVSGGTDDYLIKLFDADNNEIASTTKTLTVDFLAPKTIAFSASPNMSSTPVPTTVYYQVEDYGTETGQMTNCAGIKAINITANNVVVGQITSLVGACAKEGTFVFTPTVSGPSAKVTVCAVAADHLNHKSLPACREIFIDSLKPTPQTLELRDSDGLLITHARTGQVVTTDVFVRILDVDVNPEAVFADLSKLNPNLGNLVREDQSGEWFIWRNVPVTTPATCQVTVDAADLMGNKDIKTLQCSIGVDDTSPVPTSLVTPFVDDDGTSLIGVNGTIIAEFTEAGSGLDKGNAFLDLRELGKGAEVKATTCQKTNTDTWKCLWYVVPAVASGDYDIKIMPTSRDDLDNQVTTTLQKKIRFDNTAPANPRVKEIAAFRGQERIKTNVTSLGETVEFVVEGAGFTTVTADLTSVGGDKDTPAEHCTGNTTKTCTFGVTVAVSGPQPTSTSFTFTDVTGNTATITTTNLFILGINNETAPNYWTITTECSPEALDRKTLSVFEHPVYCRVKMQSTNSQARPITVLGPEDLSECSGDVDYISDFSVENNFAGSTEPYLVLSLVATDYAINDLTMTCPMSTLTRIGNFVPQNFEKDNATVTLQFYNLPLGELYSNMGDEVKDVEKKTDGAWKTIGQLQKITGVAEKGCQVLNTYATVMGTLSSINVVLSSAERTARATIVGELAAEGLKEGAGRPHCLTSESTRAAYNDVLVTTLKPFCDFLTCQTGLFDVLSSNVPIVGDVVSKETAREAKEGLRGGLFDVLSLGDGWAKKQLEGTVSKEGEIVQNPNVYLNVKDSLVYSVFVPPLCIPGIIYNLDKWRQTECRYGLCLLQDVREGGLPVSVCKDQKSYMQCRFVVGEIFNIIPFAPIVNYYLNIIQQALSDPLVLANLGIKFLLNCDSLCVSPVEPGAAWYICAGQSVLSQVGQSIQYIKNIKTVTKDFGDVNTGWCEQFDEALDEFEAAA